MSVNNINKTFGKKGARSGSLLGTILPFLALTGVSFLVLHHFMQHKFDRWDQHSLGDPNMKSTTLEEEYEKMTKKVDFSNWEQKSIPTHSYEEDKDK
ncbi:hypothetical protein CYY_008705 [Polysphondylium violaceum]|uniref:Cytochrome c oxidase assembly protein COX16 n=1 Tax=Polysphondylium violaceum TaxID=133409 RepID=A0A8J4PQ04_9MYCE|nr:hypothetical protein CYY_008705 [Polysphondylium violaceum]